MSVVCKIHGCDSQATVWVTYKDPKNNLKYKTQVCEKHVDPSNKELAKED